MREEGFGEGINLVFANNVVKMPLDEERKGGIHGFQHGMRSQSLCTLILKQCGDESTSRRPCGKKQANGRHERAHRRHNTGRGEHSAVDAVRKSNQSLLVSNNVGKIKVETSSLEKLK
jgi:hypothetical protein